MSRDDLRASLDSAGSTDDDEISDISEDEDQPSGTPDDSGAYPETADDDRRLSEGTARVPADTAAGGLLFGAAPDKAATPAAPSDLSAAPGLELVQTRQSKADASNPGGVVLFGDIRANSHSGYHKALPVLPLRPLNEFMFNPAELTLDSGMFIGINLALFSLGLTALAFGFWILLDNKAIGTILQMDMPGEVEGLDFSLLRTPVLFLFVVGLLSTPVGLIGMMGCVQSHIRWLQIYSKLAAVVMFIEIILVVICAVNASAFVDSMVKEVQAQMKTKYYGCDLSKQFFSLLLDYYQTKVGCCGPTSWENFNNTPWSKMVNWRASTKSTGTIIWDSGEGTAGSIRGDQELFKKSGCQERGFNLQCADMKKLKGQVWIFPASCCIHQDTTKQFENLNCLCDEARSSNLFTLVSCQRATKALLWNQLFLFIGLLATVFSMEASAISGSLTIAKKLERIGVKRILMLELAKEIIVLGGLEMGIPTEYPLPQVSKRR